MFDEAQPIRTLPGWDWSGTAEEATPVQAPLGLAVSGIAGWGPGDCLECCEDALDEADNAATGGRANVDDDPGSTGKWRMATMQQ